MLVGQRDRFDECSVSVVEPAEDLAPFQQVAGADPVLETRQLRVVDLPVRFEV